MCKVSATGVDTKLYHHHGEIEERHPYYTKLEKTVRFLTPIFSAVGVGIALLFTILKIVGSGEVVPSAISGITLGLCFIPTGAATIIRLYYTKGSVRTLRRKGGRYFQKHLRGARDLYKKRGTAL